TWRVVAVPPSLCPTFHSMLPLSFFYRSGAHRDLHSFPTRRSSDLSRAGAARTARGPGGATTRGRPSSSDARRAGCRPSVRRAGRSEEHTSELQSLTNLVCRLLLEKKKYIICRTILRRTAPHARRCT